MTTNFQILENSSTTDAQPSLSVLIPFFKDDPTKLIRALLDEPIPASSIEIVVFDDGTGNPAIISSVHDIIMASPTPVRLLISITNGGRSAARNALHCNAKSDWVLFLDADMLPASLTFLRDYIRIIRSNVADVIFGGFTVPALEETSHGKLHSALSAISDCLPASARKTGGPQLVASSNLCVRKTVLDQERFDDSFHGWGWEDSEWAARVTKRFELLHADIPALHLGLESTETLLRRFAISGANYVRFCKKQPDVASSLLLYRTCQTIRRIPGQRLIRPLLKLGVNLPILPLRLRILALKLWRASHYAQAFNDNLKT